ncbi:MAG: AsmA family protein, partial [bacterium]|nr:AsmA family protein [bacterium]
MKRFLKWTAVLVALVVLLVVGAAVAVRYFLSSEQAKLLAASYGEEALARKVRIDRLEVGLFSAEAGGIVIEGKASLESSNPPPLLRIEHVKLRLNPVALLYKRLSITEIKIRGVSLDVKRDAKGRLSFQDILDRLGEQPAPRAGRAAGRRRMAAFSLVSPAEAAEGAPAEEGLALSNMDLVIRSLVIEDVALRMDAAAAAGFPAYQVQCQFSRFVARNIRAGAPIDAELRGKCAKPAALQFDVHVVADPGKKDFFISSSFLPFPLAPFAPLVPAEARVRNLFGTIGGNLQVSVSENGKVGWNVSLKGQKVRSEIQPEKGKAWHPLFLGDLDIQSIGQVDAQSQAARVTRLDIELPFAKAQLKKPSVFNMGGKDEISLRLDVSDLSIVAVLVKAFGGPSLGAFGEKRKASFSVEASRDRRKEKGGLKFALTGNFDPLEVGPLAALLPPQETLRAPSGLFGGELDISLDESQKAKWKVRLTGEGLAAQLRPSPAEPWKPLRLSNLVFRSTGHFDVNAMAAEVSELVMTVPFAALRMTGKGLWNISNQDEIHLQVSVSKPAEAIAFANFWLPFPVEGVRSRGMVEARLDVLRDRTKGEAFTYSVAGKLDPIDVGPFVRFSPSADNLRGVTGWMDGDVSFSFTPGKEVSWRVDIAGKQLQGEIKPKSRVEWRRLQFPNLTLRSQGRANLELGMIVLSRLEADLPFARVRLPAQAAWNLDGKDEIRLDIEIADVGLALDMTGAILDLPMEKMPSGKNLTASVFAHRNRRVSDVFAYSAQATFDPLQLKSFSQFVPEGLGVRKLGGTIGGNVDLSFSREEVAQWRIALTGKDIVGDFRPKDADKWRSFGLAQLSAQTSGKYDFQADSGEIARLNVELPFLKVSSTKKMLWNYRSQDELPVSVAIPDIAKVLDLVSLVDKNAVPNGIEVGGELRGSFVLRRNRVKENRFAATGDIRANLRHVRFSDYPNMDTAGVVLARLDGKMISIFVPQAVVRQRGRE